MQNLSLSEDLQQEASAFPLKLLINKPCRTDLIKISTCLIFTIPDQLQKHLQQPIRVKKTGCWVICKSSTYVVISVPASRPPYLFFFFSHLWLVERVCGHVVQCVLNVIIKNQSKVSLGC